MAEPIPISKHPRWDGTNITWDVADPSIPHEVTGSWWATRSFPLQDLLRIVGQELDELEGQRMVIAETQGGLKAYAEVAGKPLQREYSHADLRTRAAQARRARSGPATGRSGSPVRSKERA